jgi:hypothetical protein
VPVIQHRFSEQLETDDPNRCGRLPGYQEAEHERIGRAQDPPRDRLCDGLDMGSHVISTKRGAQNGRTAFYRSRSQNNRVADPGQHVALVRRTNRYSPGHNRGHKQKQRQQCCGFLQKGPKPKTVFFHDPFPVN